MLERQYQQVVDFVTMAGRRLVARAGHIADIGITKTDLTEEDLAIERGLGQLVVNFGPDHVLYAEEENEIFPQAPNVWVVDPISGTSTFIAGLPHYAIAVAHVADGVTRFAVVYDPSVDELFTAYAEQGTLLNSKPIKVTPTSQPPVALFISRSLRQTPAAGQAIAALSDLEPARFSHSVAIGHCHVACGRYRGLVCLSKDAFPIYAGGFIISEAGGKFSNLIGDNNIGPSDRVFISGNSQTYDDLLKRLRQAFPA